MYFLCPSLRITSQLFTTANKLSTAAFERGAFLAVISWLIDGKCRVLICVPCTSFLFCVVGFFYFFVDVESEDVQIAFIEGACEVKLISSISWNIFPCQN